MASTQRLQITMFVQVHDPDGLLAHAQTLQYTADDPDLDISTALTQSVARSIGQPDRLQKMLDGVPGMLVCNRVQTSSGPAWPEVENSASEERPPVMPLFESELPEPARPLYLSLSQPLTGDDVIQLQLRLADWGFDVGRFDGVFGERTEVALRKFQYYRDLVDDGCYGPRTWRELKRFLGDHES